VLDAGLGTRLCARGLDLRRDDPCFWNLDHPDDVLDVHLRDAQAGSRVFFTNTFGANRSWLKRFGRGGDVEPLNRAAVKLARQAAGLSGFVVGDIGPSSAEHPGSAAEQAVVLADAGVDALILETFRFEPAVAALAELRSLVGSARLPVIVSLWQWPDALEDAARRLVEGGANAVGLNCQPAMSGMLSLIRRMAAAVECPLLVKPGVGPAGPDGGSAASDFADAVPALLRSNVRLIGGCCGTTEDHVAAIAAACAAHWDHDSQQRRGTAP
jgi:methionine synthase I (cobalamin-dependent)